MAYDIGPRIGIEGEKEYKQALAEISQGQKVLASELGLVSEKFNGQENTIEALNAKHDVLQRTLNGEREKVDTLRKAVESSAKAYGESDKRTEEWQIKLNKAEAELIKTERAAQQTEEAIKNLTEAEEEGGEAVEEYGEKAEDSDDKSLGLGDAIDKLGQKFGISLPGNVKQSLNSLVTFDASTLALAASVAAVTAALVECEKKLISMTEKSAAYADEILTLSTVTGISTEALQEYTYAAELLDVSVETITSSQTKLIKAMDSARDGSKQQADAFNNLGVSITSADGKLRDSETVYWEVIDALGRMQNDTERDAAAMTILGKSARDLNPLITAGSGAMRELADEANEVGYVMDSKALRSLGKVDDAMQKLNKSTEAAHNTISVQFAPYLTESIEKITKLVDKGGKVLTQSGIVDSFGMLLTSVTDIIAPLDSLSENQIPKLSKSLRPLAQTIAAIASVIDLIKGYFIGFTGNLDPLRNALGLGYMVTGEVSDMNKIQALNYQYQMEDLNATSRFNGSGEYYFDGRVYGSREAAALAAYEAAPSSDKVGMSYEVWKTKNGWNAAGTSDFPGGITWVGENGPERVILPAGTRIDNAQESRELSGGDTYYITIDAKSVREFNDIVDIVKTARMRDRKRAGR